MADTLSFLDALVRSVETAGSYNRNDQVPPAAVLWTDQERQWEPLLPFLRDRLALLTLGDYAPASRTGPSYWIRCVLGQMIDVDLPAAPPIIYLPGVGRADLRAVEDCPRLLQPLAELQYRGVLWSQPNGRDWTVAAFLQNATTGLGLEVGGDTATRDALTRALVKLSQVPVAELRKEAVLRAPYFDALLNPDEARSLLRWLNDPSGFRKSADTGEWAAFRGVCRSKYGFDPEGEGELTAALHLGRRNGAWSVVWSRYAEAPRAYPNLPALLRQARPKDFRPLIDGREAWPQENEVEEARLRQQLRELAGKLPDEARNVVAGLEGEHGERRARVWADLGQAPLAMALESLVDLAKATLRALAGASRDDVATRYAEEGWKADAAVLDTLARVETPEDLAAVEAAIEALYRPWLEAAAVALQGLVARAGWGPTTPVVSRSPEPGTCVLFSDGLRLDLARRLSAEIGDGFDVSFDWRFAALPTVTATSKPDVAPVADLLTCGPGLDPTVASGGARVTVEVLRRLLVQQGWQILRGDELGDPATMAWTELGDIDAYVHEHGWKVARQAAAEICSLRARILALLAHGWRKIVVVTDHGWLLLPGGLPKADLPEHLAEVRKGRCARLKPSATTGLQTVPWRWDTDVSIAVAPGIHCFEAGREGEHGGISPQECVTPILTITAPTVGSATVGIESVIWRRLRCQITLVGASPDLAVDLRLKANDPASTLAHSPPSPKPDGTVSLVVPDAEREGQAAVVVVLDPRGKILAQQLTTVGG